MGGVSKFLMLLSVPFPSVLHRPSSLTFLHRLSKTTNLCHFTVSYSKSFRHRLHIAPRSALRETNTNSPREGLHPWPELSHLISRIFSQGKDLPAPEAHGLLPEDAFVAYEEKTLSDEFVRCASACLAFARSRPDLLGLLVRKDIEVIVSNGTPFLFKTALATSRRMRAFLGLEGNNYVLESEKANTVDIMKYILSYASNPSGSTTHGSLYSREFVESSIRNLLCQMTEMSFGNPAIDVPASDQYQFSGGYNQSARPLRQNVEMKRGDWICPKCSFMNFARNVKCLECEERRPKRQLTGREWECPQCNFFNYGKNLVCLRCDCKRPGEVVANNANSMSELGYTRYYVDKSNMDSRVVENEEKAKRWFSKVSQLNSASEISSAADDEDFPEIMPLRKGENRFVVSTRKTPLERRLVNSQNQKHLGDYNTSEGSASQNEDANESLDLSIRKSLDQILGWSSPASGMDVQGKAPTDKSAFPRPSPSEFHQPEGSNSNYIPFVPLPADMFSKQNQNSKVHAGEDAVKGECNVLSPPASCQSASVTVYSDSQKSGDGVDFAEKQPESRTGNDKNAEEQDGKSERWFQRVAELHNVKDLPSAISDEEFPEIMPMRRGENRFVISKKKDRSLTSPAYKRQVAMEQASNSNFVPFVPFPSGYFARKEAPESNEEHSENSNIAENYPENPDTERPRVAEGNSVQETGNHTRSSEQQSPSSSGVHAVPLGEDSRPNTVSSENIRAETQSSGYSSVKHTSQSMRLQTDSMQENQTDQSEWKGKSLEGSAVMEPDPLDMSEEAKAERWFRRVAQIKDISELSQIPDEDFPSIMPMRKGVNRFVVSKRKTPLERRLTSPQYRRNLPTVSSDPVNKENESS